METFFRTAVILLATAAFMSTVARAQGTVPPSNGGAPGSPSDLPTPQVVRPANPAETIAPGTPVVQAAQSFSLADAEQLALANNPSLPIAAARVEAARGRWVQGGLPPNPTAGFAGNEIGDEGRAGQLGFYVGQEVVTGGKLRLNRAVATTEIAKAERNFSAQRWRVLTDVRTAFYDVLVAQRRVEIAAELVRIGERGAATADVLLRGQQASRADFLQARVELNSARMLHDNARTAHEGAWQQLSAVIGMPGILITPVTGDLRAIANDCSFDQVLMQLLSNSPELAAAEAGVARARQALERARVEWVPNLDLQAGAQHDNASGSDIANVQIGMPIPVLNRNQGGIRQAQAHLAAAQNNVARLRLNLQQRLAAAYQQYMVAKQQVERYEQGILPDAKESLDLITSAYAQGEYEYLMFLTAQRTFFHTNLAYLDSQRQLQRGRVEIDGLLLSGSLQTTDDENP